MPRVLLKVGRVHRMRRNTEIIRILLPAAAPYLFTGVKLASAYSFIGIIAGEFILSGGGLDYAIAYAYEAFDNHTTYALKLLVLVVATAIDRRQVTEDGRRRKNSERKAAKTTGPVLRRSGVLSMLTPSSRRRGLANC